VAKIGFIGLGIMGKPMARNLLKAGHTLLVFDTKHASRDALVADGATAAASGKDVAAGSEIVITMVQDSPEVEAAVMGPAGVLEGAHPGLTVVDMSSICPLCAQKVGAACAAAGVDFLDAPVSGSEPKAVAGTLAVMVGGDQRVFDRVEPVLKAMASSVTLIGPVGAGNMTKLANQIIVACNIAAMGEALVLTTKAGLDPQVVVDAIKGGLAGSTVMNAKSPMVIGRDFKPGFRVRLHEKDLRNALSSAESMKVPLPITSLVQQMIMSLMNDGKGELDHSAIVNFTEALAKVEVKRPE
jgi:2-hydroxy-3-oxopropionate reductase